MALYKCCIIIIIIIICQLHFCLQSATFSDCVQGSAYSLFLYDAVYLYMTMMQQIVSERLDWRNGTFWRIMARNWVTYGQWICQVVVFTRQWRLAYVRKFKMW